MVSIALLCVAPSLPTANALSPTRLPTNPSAPVCCSPHRCRHVCRRGPHQQVHHRPARVLVRISFCASCLLSLHSFPSILISRVGFPINPGSNPEYTYSLVPSRQDNLVKPSTRPVSLPPCHWFVSLFFSVCRLPRLTLSGKCILLSTVSSKTKTQSSLRPHCAAVLRSFFMF